MLAWLEALCQRAGKRYSRLDLKGCISALAVRWGRARRGFWQCCLAGCPCSGLSMPASGRNAVRELCTALCRCIWWDVWLAHSADCWSSSSGLFLLSLSFFFLSIWPLSKVSCWKLPPDHPGCAQSPVLSFSPSQSDARSPPTPQYELSARVNN